jgi:hypothetical protein
MKKILTFEEAKEWLKKNYSDEKVCEMFDEEVSSGNWIDAQQYEEENYGSEHDYYIDYGRGEAESAVMNMIFDNLKLEYELDFDLYSDDTDLFQFIKEEYTCMYGA